MKFSKAFFVFWLLLSSSFGSIHGAFGSQGSEAKKNKFRERQATDDSMGYPNLAGQVSHCRHSVILTYLRMSHLASRRHIFLERIFHTAPDPQVGSIHVTRDEDSLLNTQCPQHVELRWQTEVSSSIYATPLVADINGDGKLDIVVPSFVHYLEVLEGSDGDKMPGWPAFHQSTVHSSPLLFDIDKDGVREIALPIYNGEVLFFRVSGYLMTEKLEVPRLRVHKNWYVGLHQDPVDRSHPDVHDDLLIQEAAAEAELLSKMNRSVTGTNTFNVSKLETDAKQNATQVGQEADSEGKLNATQVGQDPKTEAKLNAMQVGQKFESAKAEGQETDSEGKLNATQVGQDPKTESKLNAMQVGQNFESAKTEGKFNATPAGENIKLPVNPDNITRDEGSMGNSTSENSVNPQRRLLQDTQSKGTQDGGTETHVDPNRDTEMHAATVENDESLEEDADSSFDIFREGEELADEYNYDYDDYVDESMWGDEEWTEGKHEKMEDYVNIDSHILSTPVIADIDNDGIAEMVVAVSYFFDHEYYDNPDHLAELGGIDISKYVAGGIVVFNLETKQVKWTAQLDMSTDTGKFRAYIYSSPTVADLDGDGNLDILLGTSFGLFYVLDHHGKVRDKFPLEMAEIQGSVVAADINDDGKIELLTTDSHGNVAAWTAQGDEIWEVHLKSLVPQGPTVGDVDQDGHTDVVVPTISGNIYVLSGKDGSFVRPYPYRTHGKVMSQVLLLDLSKHGEKKKGLTLVTTSFDGYLYLIDGPSSCADVVDIGETSYSMVLADNVDGGDDLDLIVTTMNGNVFCFSTPARHHPLKAWRSSNQGRNNVASQYNREGIYVNHPSRAYRDEEGKSFWVDMEIVDNYRFPSGTQGPYNVTTTLLVPGNYQGDRRIVHSQIVDQPGKHRVKLPTVPVRTTGTVVVEMVDKNGLYFSDEFSLTFHMHYYKILKWLLVLPMIGMFGVLVILRPQEGTPLPSFSRNTDL